MYTSLLSLMFTLFQQVLLAKQHSRKQMSELITNKLQMEDLLLKDPCRVLIAKSCCHVQFMPGFFQPFLVTAHCTNKIQGFFNPKTLGLFSEFYSIDLLSIAKIMPDYFKQFLQSYDKTKIKGIKKNENHINNHKAYYVHLHMLHITSTNFFSIFTIKFHSNTSST